MPTRKKTSFAERFKRYVKILRACQFDRPSITDLSLLCNVCRRTIFRDLRMLQKLGISIYLNPITRRYQIASPIDVPTAVSISPDEAFVLFTLCQEIGRSRFFPFFDISQDAANKLLNALPSQTAKQLHLLSGKLLFRKTPVTPLVDAEPVFELLKTSIQNLKAIRIWYKSPKDPAEICTLLHPYRIMFANRSWYVVGRASLFRATRTFQMGRIIRAELTETPYEIPRGFSLDRYLRNAWCLVPESGPDHDVIIHFSPVVAQNVAEIVWHKTQQVVQNPDGSIQFHVRVSGLNEIKWWIMQYGKEAEVLSPPALRELVREHVLALSKIYSPE